ncbi:MAG TPA: hypothetical protein ENH45_06180, partial [Nitrospirae bacterium]|nr:hypothetical protein [Nitrospirota bacterium]
MINIFTFKNNSADSNPDRKSISAYIIRLVILSITLLLLNVSAPYAETSPLIKSVEINGGKKISESTIYSKIKSKVGDPFSKNTVQEDIKRIYRIGYFDDVRVDIDSFEGGVKLIFILIEKPTIVSIDYQGNDEFEENDIKEHVTITPGAISNLSLITDNVKKIVSFYQSKGYWLAKVVPVIRDISDDTVALTFQIDEGAEVAVREITIEGNNALSRKKILKVMETEEKGFFSFFTNSGVYRKDQIRVDIQNIKSLYQNNGYIFASVSEPSIILGPEKRKLYITIAVSEGEQYRVGKIGIEGNTLFPEEELYEKLETASGEIFDRSLLRKDIDFLLDMYMEKGYARADINPDVTINKDKKTADIIFSLTQGNIFRIGKINIEGNTKT